MWEGQEAHDICPRSFDKSGFSMIFGQDQLQRRLRKTRTVPLCSEKNECGHRLLDVQIQEGIGAVREKCESLMTEFRKVLV